MVYVRGENLLLMQELLQQVVATSFLKCVIMESVLTDQYRVLSPCLRAGVCLNEY